jgi:membrane protein DedA with SNARE-associated domain
MGTLREIFLSIGTWTYVLVGLDILLESSAFLGLVLPGDSVVILMGVLAGGGIFSLWGSAALVVACAFFGDSLGYSLGRYKGGEVLEKIKWFRRQYEKRHEDVERYAHRFGSGIIFIGRFLPFIRAVTPFTMGMAGMKPTRFFPAAAITSLVWAGGFFVLGVFFGQHWQFLDSILAPVGGGIMGAIVVGILIWTAWKYREQIRAACLRIAKRFKTKLGGSLG